MEAEADEVVCLCSPEDFYAVGQFFEDFSEVTDDMVVGGPDAPAKAWHRNLFDDCREESTP